ncbi:ribosome-associated translation inhibitor RaiA [Oscillospiraceae bacterium CM]|nr:ribosome-associated translation inhibitor RaiA [Oscillospiraceae bacterium CM]
MKFTVTEKKVQVSDELRDYAQKKIGKLDRFFKLESEAFITFSIERGRHKAEVTLNNNGMFYRVTESTNDMYATIDAAVAAIESQFRKNKARLSKRLRDGALEREVKPSVTYVPDDEEPDFQIIRTKRFPIKPMAPEEAILQMNLLDHEFFVFRNQENAGAFTVVYRRNNGGYGLIESND